MSNTFSYFIWYNSLNYFNEHIKIQNHNLKNDVIGLISGLTVDIIMNPLRVLKTNFQNSNNINFKKYKIY